jgi:hypothetical protein
MKKYHIPITPPKIKKMKDNGKVVISTNGNIKILPLGEANFLEFEMPDDVPWIHNNKMKNNDIFDVKLIYSNKDGTKEEIISPVPEEICNLTKTALNFVS